VKDFSSRARASRERMGEGSVLSILVVGRLVVDMDVGGCEWASERAAGRVRGASGDAVKAL
jgi:hypothetical protein